MAFVPGEADGVLNGTSSVTLVSAPSNNTTQRLVKYLTVFNRDTAAVTFNVQINNNGTLRYLTQVTLAVNTNWIFGEHGESLVLDTTNKSVVANMTGAAATTNPDWTSHYADSA